MAQEITTMIAQPWVMPSGLALTVTDSGAGSPRTVSLAAAAGRTFRTFLADTDADTGTGINAGTEADPDEWLRYLAYRLNDSGALALWTVTMTATGHVRVGYAGTGFGTVDWNGAGGTSLVPRYLTGFADDVACSAGGSDTATKHPTHVVYSINARANASNWQLVGKPAALGQLPTGAVYGFVGGRTRRTFTADWRFHPYDETARDERGAAGTVYMPPATDRWTQPSETPSTSNAPPWSLTDFFGTAHRRRCGVALGNFQRLVAANEYTFFDCYVAPETLKRAGDLIAPTDPGDAAYVDARGVVLNYHSHESR